MLIAIRDKITGVVAWILVIVIGLAFSLFGLRYYLQGNVTTYAAKVNDTEISYADLDRAYKNRRQQLINSLGDDFDPRELDEELLKRISLDTIISSIVLADAATDAGFIVDDRMVARQVQSTQAFLKDGRFSRDRYERLLKLQGMSPAEYEGNIRHLMLVDQFVTALSDTEILLGQDLSLIWGMQGQERKLDTLILSEEQIGGNPEILEQDINARYEKFPDRYMEPEQVKLEYVELSADKLGAETDLTEAEIARLYEERIEEFGTPEERRARHILISVPKDAEEALVSEARGKAERVAERINAGESFETLAAELSDDPGSKTRGGDLGFFSRGLMVPEFDAVVFSQQIGDVSSPVRSDFGFHVIKLVDIRAADVKSLEEVRTKIVRDERHERGLDLLFKELDTLESLAFESPGSLTSISEEIGLAIQETDWVYRTGGSGIAAESLVIEAAFSDDVLENGNNSVPLELKNDRVVVVRVKEHKEAHVRPLELVKEQIITTLQIERYQAELARQGQEALQRLQSGESMESLATDLGLDVEAHGFVTRVSVAEDPAVINKAYELPVPAESGNPSYGGLVLNSGDYVLLRVSEVKDGDINSLTEGQLKVIRQQYQQVYTQYVRTAVAADLRSRVDIVYGRRVAPN